MSKVAILTDSNSGITQSEAKDLGVYVLPMPFYFDGELFYEDIDLSQEDFYTKLEESKEITTSMPLVGEVMDKWDELLEEYDEVVYIPMSSGLSSSCETAYMLSQDYDGKVVVADLQRISVTMKLSVLDAKRLADEGKSAAEIKEILEETKMDSFIYITVNTLDYLRKGGRLTPAVAAIGSLLKIKPVLQIRGEKLDKFAMARTMKQAKQTMLDAIEKNITEDLKDPTGENTVIAIAHTNNYEAALEFKEEVLKRWPDREVWVDPLSLSVSCHIGPGSLAVTCTKRLDV
ncbi:MAG: DegV family protein [Lachnospiraceae bacterium]|jgi:DegV family protein with EDD domain|nr:DegV family protein [Lachnospiraceae bacterium]MBQ4300233.1 DegV family protein [Lachnospiraceae bacterium]